MPKGPMHVAVSKVICGMGLTVLVSSQGSQSLALLICLVSFLSFFSFLLLLVWFLVCFYTGFMQNVTNLQA